MDALRLRLQEKQETLMHMQNNKLPAGSAGATDDMARFANEQLHRVHAAQERLLSVPSVDSVANARPAPAPESLAPVSGAGANRGFSKPNARPDLFLASAAPVAFVPPNFLPRERDIRPVFVNDAPAPAAYNVKSELFKPTSPLHQRVSQPAQSTSSARDEVWERKRQQALAAGLVQPSQAPQLLQPRSQQQPSELGAQAKSDSRSIRDEIWEQKKKSRGALVGGGIGENGAGAAPLRANHVAHHGEGRRVSFAAPSDDGDSVSSFDLIQRVFQHSDDKEGRDDSKKTGGAGGLGRFSFEADVLGVPSNALQQERNKQLSNAMELQLLRQKPMQQDFPNSSDQRRSTSVPRLPGDAVSNFGTDIALSRGSDARNRQQEYAMELQQQMQQKQMARRMPEIDHAPAQNRPQGAGGGLMIGEAASQRESDARNRQQEYAMELQQQMREKDLAKRMQANVGGGVGMQQDAQARMAAPSHQQRSFEIEARNRQQEYAMELQQQMREKEQSNRMQHFGTGMLSLVEILFHASQKYFRSQ